ncbi:MAG: tetratricopeptide repeat protein [Bacteroidia bacterium]|nr:tetratricopeptide repeat protein [Bacteroidia bacterium]
MRKFVIIFLLLSFRLLSHAQPTWNRSDNTALRKGNEAYEKEDFEGAANFYQQSLSLNPENEKSGFNYGDALYSQKKHKDAAGAFLKAAEKSKDPDFQAKAYYNAGNSMLAENQFQESIEAYKEAIRKNPSDENARYNLSYALQKLKQQQQNQDKNQEDKKEDEKKEQEKKEQEQKEKEEQEKKEQEKKEQEQKEQDKKEGKKEEPKPEEKDTENNQPQPSQKMSEEEAKRLLQALKQEEEKVRQRYQMQKNNRPPNNTNNKDW